MNNNSPHSTHRRMITVFSNFAVAKEIQFEGHRHTDEQLSGSVPFSRKSPFNLPCVEISTQRRKKIREINTLNSLPSSTVISNLNFFKCERTLLQDMWCCIGGLIVIFSFISAFCVVIDRNLTGLIARPRLNLPVGLLTVGPLLHQQPSNHFKVKFSCSPLLDYMVSSACRLPKAMSRRKCLHWISGVICCDYFRNTPIRG